MLCLLCKLKRSNHVSRLESVGADVDDLDFATLYMTTYLEQLQSSIMSLSEFPYTNANAMLIPCSVECPLPRRLLVLPIIKHVHPTRLDRHPQDGLLE